MNFAHSETAEGIRKALGSILRTRRESARRTLSEIAAEAGLSPGHPSEAERGRKEISVETLLALTHAPGLHLAQVLADMASTVTTQLLFLENEAQEQDIQIYVNSPGGSLTAALSIYDAMQYVGPKVATLCTGLAASGASILLAGGKEGMRMSLPHAQILIHQPFTQGIQGQATDIQIHAQEILRQREQLARIYDKHCKRQLEDVERAMERDFFMTPEQAKDWGLIDMIVEKNPHMVAPTATK